MNAFTIIFLVVVGGFWIYYKVNLADYNKKKREYQEQQKRLEMKRKSDIYLLSHVLLFLETRHNLKLYKGNSLSARENLAKILVQRGVSEFIRVYSFASEKFPLGRNIEKEIENTFLSDKDAFLNYIKADVDKLLGYYNNIIDTYNLDIMNLEHGKMTNNEFNRRWRNFDFQSTLDLVFLLKGFSFYLNQVNLKWIYKNYKKQHFLLVEIRG